MDIKDILWQEFRFDLVIHSKKVRFAHHITTDGVTVSLLVLHIPPNGLPECEPGVQVPTTEEEKKQAEEKKQQKQKEYRAKQKEKRKNKAATRRSNIEAAKAGKPVVYPLADEEELKKRAEESPDLVVGVDTGKLELLTMANGKKRMRYTRFQRQSETGSKRREQKTYQALTEEQKQILKEDIAELAKHKANTSSLEVFLEYVKARHKAMSRSGIIYKLLRYREDRFHNWSDRRSSEDRMANRAKKMFGKDAIYAFGNGSGFHCLPHSPPTPTKALRKIFYRNKMRTIIVPERNTTKLCSRCGQVLEEMPDRRLPGRNRNPRGIRRCTSVQCRSRIWHRDINAAINIRANLLHRLENGEWKHYDW